MSILVVYESMYGNTRAIAEAVAEGLSGAGEIAVRPVHEAGSDLDGVELLVAGGPTHMHGLATGLSRRMSVEAAREDGTALDPSATAELGLRLWLRDLPKHHGAAAAFDR
jgi:hypothetical protein